MKDDKYKPLTKRIARRLLEFGVVLPPETTVHEVNRILCLHIVAKERQAKTGKEEIDG
jgi:hypothetical protein